MTCVHASCSRATHVCTMAPVSRFAFDLAQWFTENSEQVVRDLDRYFASFRGRWFDHFAAIGDPNRFEASDVLAIEALSVEVPSEAAARLLITESERFNSLLREIPRAQDLWEARRLEVDIGDKAELLHNELRTLPGVDWVVAGKIMAAKRPRFIPILDNKVRDFIAPPKDYFWVAMHDELSNDSRRRTIEAVCQGAPSHVSLLRRIDVAWWMAAAHPTSPKV